MRPVDHLAPTSPPAGRFTRTPMVWAVPVALIAVMVLLPYVLDENTVRTLQQVLALAVFATATNLLLGQGGLVSFGQAVF